MITKKELENAARAMGHEIVPNALTQAIFVTCEGNKCKQWNPLDPTKADLLYLMLALKICFTWVDAETYESVIASSKLLGKFVEVRIINTDKHAALAEAVVSVASQIWESKNGNV
jgi:hypothetical protein